MHTISRTIPPRRAVVLCVVATLAALVTALTTALLPSAQAATSLRAQTGGGVLQRYLADHDNHFENGGYPDGGLTLDGVIAMDAAGVGDYRSEKVTQWVADNLTDYAGDGQNESYAGATAKALLVSLSQNAPAGSLGGAHLVQRLEALEAASGRFTDKSQYGDFSNVIGQSLALVALSKAGEPVDYDAIAFLRQQQCANGGFKLDPDDAVCSSDPDATSFAVQGLLATPQTATTQRRIGWAIDYLKSQMNASGGVKGGTSTSSPNANSTGLAVMAFDSTGNGTLASKGRSYLISLRYGCGFPKSMRGAFAYNAAGRNAAKAKGAAATLTDQDLRATTQAVLGFSQVALKDLTNSGAAFSSPTVSC